MLLNSFSASYVSPASTIGFDIFRQALTKDRGILLIWDGNGSFYWPHETRRDYSFLE